MMHPLAMLWLLTGTAALWGAPKAPADPKITSIHPYALRSGTATSIVVRGTGLAGARVLVADRSGVTARMAGVETEGDTDRVRMELTTPEGFTGMLRVRLLAARGVSNELALRVVAERTMIEPAEPVSGMPLVVTGCLCAKGETDTIWLQAKRGDVVTFTASSGVAGFDPSISLEEPSGSWFDESRMNRLAFNDEPLHFPGLAQDARLVHRFEKDGRYAVQLRAFSGQGGPDFTYLLRMATGVGELPLLHPPASKVWEERRFTRKVDEAWMKGVSARGAGAPVKAPAMGQGAGVAAKEAPMVAVPAIVEGRITKPAEVHRVRVNIDKAQDLAIEVETPEATMPRFNPVVRLLAPEGHEIVTNVYTKRNNNGLYMMKMIQAKSTVTLRSSGEYILEIRDITTDVAGDDFAYRVLVRPQIAHVGKVDVPEDHINIEPGQSKPVTVNLEREEGFAGLVLVAAEGLPAGVTATAGMANPVERPPLPNGGRLERYVGKPQTASLILSAADDAAPGELPVMVKVLVRTLIDGRQSAPMVVKEIPVIVIPRRPS